MGRIAFMSNREEENSFFSRKEDYRWKAISSEIRGLLSQSSWRGHTFLIPVFTKFDRYVLQLAEQLGNPVEFYFPSEDWGKKMLPNNDIERIERMRRYYPAHIVKGNMNRLEKMCHDADGIVVLRNQLSLGGLEKAVVQKHSLEMHAEEIVNRHEEYNQVVAMRQGNS